MIIKVRSDHGKEFENLEFKTFYEDHGITHQFSAPRTPQQNGVVERKNRTLVEMTRSMLCENRLPSIFELRQLTQHATSPTGLSSDHF